MRRLLTLKQVRLLLQCVPPGEALRFERAYCQYPVCNPSRSSFLSGLYPESNKVLDNKTLLRDVQPDIVTLPEFFKNNGYWTGGVGKVFHGKFDEGKRAWHEFHKFSNARNPGLEKLKAEFEKLHGKADDPKNRRKFKAFQKEKKGAFGGQTPAGYGATTMTDLEHMDGQNAAQVIQWLKGKSWGDKPFFIACGIHKPHVPFWAPKKYFDMYPPDKITFLKDPENDWDNKPELAKSGRYRSFGVPAGDDAKRREVTAAYHACISFIDVQIGKILDAVKEQKLWEDTIVIFISDHGYHLGEHGMWGKVTLFEECARVPMIVRVPGQSKGGTVSKALVELVDIYPTLAELSGLKPPARLEGLSFKPLLTKPKRSWKQGAFTVVSRGKILGRSVRSERWRYAEWGGPRQAELYDLYNDPRELNNLVADGKHQKALTKMRGLLRKGWQAARPIPE